MILKARYKTFEDMPEWAKCCPTTISGMLEFCGTSLELDSNVIIQNYNCPNCGQPYTDGMGKALPVISPAFYRGCAVNVSLVDIDEGSVYAETTH